MITIKNNGWTTPNSFTCKTILAFDADALYLWAIMQDMPVGKYKHITEYNIKDLIKDILMKKLFGFVDVDIKVQMHYMINFLNCCQSLKILLLIALVIICLIKH